MLSIITTVAVVGFKPLTLGLRVECSTTVFPSLKSLGTVINCVDIVNLSSKKWGKSYVMP